MKYLKRFNENISMYDPEWEKSLPETFSILKGEDDGVHKHVYKKGNIMLNSDMVQITYASTNIDSQESGEIWGSPDTLEFEVVEDWTNFYGSYYRVKVDGKSHDISKDNCKIISR